MVKKTIRLFCYGPITISNKVKSGWEDVWIQYKVGKKKLKKEGPTLISYPDLIQDIKSNKDMLEKNKNALWAESVKENLKIFEIAKSCLDNDNQFTMFKDDSYPDIPVIITRKEWINKEHAEEMITWYLRKIGVLKSEPRFRWNKPKFIINPVSLK